MRIRTDDEIYRVDAVWLGPPKATLPWRARYVAWGVGAVVFLVVLGVERRLGIGFGFFSTAWAIVITIVLTRLLCSRINQERPLGAVSAFWLRELTAPRQITNPTGGAVSAAKIRVSPTRPRPNRDGQKRGKRQPNVMTAPSGSARDSGLASSPSRRELPRRARTKEVPFVRQAQPLPWSPSQRREQWSPYPAAAPWHGAGQRQSRAQQTRPETFR